MRYAHLVNLEDDWARMGSFMMTVPLDQIIDLCVFNGDLDKIAGYLCQKDVEKEANEISEDPPNCHSPRLLFGRKHRWVCKSLLTSALCTL